MNRSAPVKTFELVASTPLVALEDYVCRLGHRGAGDETCTTRHVINLHGHGTYVKHVDGREVFVEPGSVVFYAREEAFRTSHPHGCGDGGRRITLRDDVLVELCASADPSAAARPERPLRVGHLAPDPATTLAIEVLFARAPHAEGLEVEERSFAVVSSLARRAVLVAGARNVSRRRDPRAARRDRQLADALRGRLARSLDRPCELDALSRELGAPPYALCRAFRAETGTTMSAWRRRARLQQALERVLGSREELLSIALELGFASHSHLTREFRAEFGVTPSALRRGVQWRDSAASRERRS